MAKTPDPNQLLSEIRAELHQLSERVRRLEEVKAPPIPAVESNAPEAADPEALAEETLLVISAAVAAYLGERAHIRQVRLVTSPAWAQQGRVSIQASHLLHSHR